MAAPTAAEVVDAIKAKDFARLERAMDLGAPLNDFVDGKTPLAHAASVGFLKGVEYLLGLYGIKANKGKPDGTSPLIIAASKDRKKTLEKMLLFPDVNINHADESGNTALHKAIKKNASEAFNVLIENADINLEKENARKETALQLAAQENKPLFVEKLLQKGANVDHKSNEMSIYDKAARRHYDPLINRMITNMRRYGAPLNTSVANVEVKPLAELGEGVQINLYPVTAKGAEFLTKVTALESPYPVKFHSVAEGIAFKPTLFRMQSLVREICTGLEPMYLFGKIQKIDFYLTLTYDDPLKLIGFVYVTIYKTAKDFFIDLICTRKNVKGAGAFLMDYCIALSLAARFKKMSLDSVYTAVTFYEKFGFEKTEQSDKDIIDELQPMILTLPAAVTAAASRGRTAKNGAGAGKKTTRKKRTPKANIGRGAGAE